VAATAWLLLGCGPAPPPAAGAGGAPERGRLLLAQYQCGSCHAIPGVPGSRGQVATSLEAFGQRSYIAGRLANGPDVLARWIESPQSVAPGTLMPDMGVPPGDARDMAAYLMARK
jgi:cytochrome c